MPQFSWEKGRELPRLVPYLDGQELKVLRETIVPGPFILEIAGAERAADDIMLSPELLADGIFIAQKYPGEPNCWFGIHTGGGFTHLQGTIGYVTYKAGRKPGPKKKAAKTEAKAA